MAENLCFFSKDTRIVKPPKKSPLVLKLVVLVFAMVCGVYICSICLRQSSMNTTLNTVVNFPFIQSACPPPDVKESEKAYLHYPKPITYSRAECACNPVRFFAILLMQRSGSGWFETLLNNHTNVSSNGEIFSVKERRSNISSIVSTLDKVYNLDWLSSASKNECTAAVGFKWMLNQAQILAQYKPTVNGTILINNLKKENDTTMKALRYFNSTRHILVYYEDIINNRTKLNDVQEFLRVLLQDLKSHQVKIHKGSLAEQVANWDDVDKTLKGTQFESFLHADYTM